VLSLFGTLTLRLRVYETGQAKPSRNAGPDGTVARTLPVNSED
jgi:hypothetical protein